MNIELYDITIIGGGPVGLFGAFYAGLRGMRTKIIDSLPELGGQLTALYPEKYVYDMPGFPEVLAKDLAAQMIRQAMRFKPTVCLEERAEQLQRTENGWVIITDKGITHHTRTIVICAGAGAFAPRKLNAEGVAEFEGNGVYYGVRDKSLFAGKRLLIVGGGDSAVDWALNLYPIAQQVTLIHRRDEFRAHEQSVQELRHSPVRILTPYELRRVCGNGRLERAILFHNKTQEELELLVDAVILNLGFVATLGPIKNWGLELQGNQIVVDEYMQTNLPGVYAAGDVCTHPGKLKLIATGVGEVCTAVNHAKSIIDPSAKMFPGHSSDMALPSL
ncbi:MAG: ferredoxin--NADP(+) reductase [Armatimonadetes bacterium JP3_11]|jgi:thioredoxin reductase (NADPH)|nr:MAG: ferredoxin--NADP(+) reductase [Armatimonadetes bacterium CP1_7O]OYT75797.1 MAG: ferredoxin--NADP(+) reductase [Armatimonadetes bacterium JP3_11]RMH07950.1 MAG: NAD(P)/FAD-dependent oxidoreductase [Armatimonadota bacterium]